jgi:SAM-dependent methyltransferase
MGELHDAVRDWWDADALTYDASAGHAMSDPVEVAAWAAALRAVVPPPPGLILDVGSGTGAMALLAADLGYEVTGIDLSEGMLDRARQKAAARGLSAAFLRRAAEDPPSGPFDAVIERHVAWTLPDPVGAFRAWRSVTRPGGSLVLLEGSFGGPAVREELIAWLERMLGVPAHHHDVYPAEILARVPLAGATTPAPFLDAARAAGWSGVRLYRLRDVEWAVAARQPWPLRRLTARPRFAVVATA